MTEFRAVGPNVVEGWVDGCVEGIVRGWARWCDTSDEPVHVEVVIDGLNVGEGIASMPRRDLQHAGKGNCGFQIVINPSLVTKPAGRATVRAKNGPPLPGGRIVIPLAELRSANENSRVPAWFEALRELEDGEMPGDRMLDAIHEEILVRARAAGAGDAPPQIRLSDLRVWRKQVPNWWVPNGNVILAAANATFKVGNNPFVTPGFDNLVVLGDGVGLGGVTVSGRGGLAAIGDHCELFSCQIFVTGRSAVLIGEKTTCTFLSMMDARNGGTIVVGADNMWASGVTVATDDDHAIRDLETGARLNVFGGRVVIGPHVWLCADVRVLGNTVIGANTVVGQGSFVKSVLPPNSICVGRPAKPIRSGITWTREDAP